MERSRRAQLASRLYHQGGYTIGALVIVIVILLAMACQEAESSLFTLVSPGHSGITFENTITESDSFNILDYEYLYNGGGVALADFNNDGQLDVFFTGNMVANRLYLNEGHLIFREISEAAGVQAVGSWCSGVAVVDINCDGWLDLYIAVNTHEPARRRQNLLFVNQGLNGDEGEIAFREEAASYGLADTSHTMNAVFFDYDNDEDLDVFLIVNEMQDSRNPSQYREKKVEQDARRVDRLYRNDWNDSLEVPFYVNVSAEAGISVAGYSLGVNVVDINSDGWKDIYISNDFISNDVFYINNQDGTFKDAANELFKHTSHSAMGNDVADLNNDGMLDILTLDMLPEDNYRKKTMLGPVNYMSYINNRKFGYDHQYVRNTLQLNQGVDPESGKVVFSEVAFFAGISATDWSWTPLVADFDHNTYRDLIITNGFPKDITDRDFVDYQVDVQAYASKPFLLERIPEVKLKNYAYRNMGSLVFEDVSESWGIDRTSFSNGAAYGDLDNDGDLDYVVNNINDTAFVYENLLKHGTVDSSQHYLRIRLEGSAKNPQAQGATIRLQSGDLRQVYEYSIYRGYLSSIEGVAHFGMGQKPSVDSVTVTWPDGTSTTIMDVPVDQEIVISYETSKRETAAHQAPSNGTEPIWENTTASLHLNFIHEEFDYVDFNVQPLLPHKLSQYGPGLAVGDINSDGLADLYVTGSTFHSGSLFLQQPDGSFKDSDWKQSEEDKRHEELGALFFDVDNDQDDDLYLVSGGYEFNPQDSFYYDRLYVNDGGELKLTEKVIPQLASSGSCVRAADFDKDGDLDLFVAGRVH
ncbi:MAG: VCBS repeat-containing protein, partial [Saprospiraceae bacterium]|nr:VCBS repeat-containing protein [Saprospiraceae bacterium]